MQTVLLFSACCYSSHYFPTAAKRGTKCLFSHFLDTLWEPMLETGGGEGLDVQALYGVETNVTLEHKSSHK